MGSKLSLGSAGGTVVSLAASQSGLFVAIREKSAVCVEKNPTEPSPTCSLHAWATGPRSRGLFSAGQGGWVKFGKPVEPL